MLKLLKRVWPLGDEDKRVFKCIVCKERIPVRELEEQYPKCRDKSNTFRPNFNIPIFPNQYEKRKRELEVKENFKSEMLMKKPFKKRFKMEDQAEPPPREPIRLIIKKQAGAG